MKLVSRRLAALVCCLLIITASVPTLPAQQTNSKQTNNEKAFEKKEETKEKQKAAIGNKQKRRKKAVAKSPRAKKVKPTTQNPNPISVVNGTTNSEVLTGQAKVIVKGNFDPIIRLGIARNGVAVVEFPASDNFFAVHPGGGSEIVTVDESPTLATDHFLVFRAGKDFVSSLPNTKNNADPKATVSVQMQSGMFVTLMFYPVRDVTRMAHRCVVVYSREEVTATRREAGLAVNLSEKVLQEDAKQTPSIPVKKEDEANKETGEISKRTDDKNVGLILKTKEVLQSVLAAPTKFASWSKPLHGLSISSLEPVDIDESNRLVIIAVKNTTSKNLRLIEGGPDIDLVTMGGKGNPVLIQSLTKLHVETTAANNTVPSNSIVYYALLFEPPILSVNQHIRFMVANSNAADEPAAIFLFK